MVFGFYLSSPLQYLLMSSLPNLQNQKEIVKQVELEEAAIKSNADLIQIFDQKIKDKIASVWGE